MKEKICCQDIELLAVGLVMYQGSSLTSSPLLFTFHCVQRLHCFKCTDWNVLLDSQGNSMDTDLDRMVHCTTDYINFCRNTVSLITNLGSPVTSMPSSTRKRRTLRLQEEAQACATVQHELTGRLQQAKGDKRRKVERKLWHNNTREV